MIFTSISFLYYFLPIVLLVYFLVPKSMKNFILLIASLFFYFYGEQKYILVMLAEIVLAYFGTILLDKYNKKSIFIILISIHVMLLGFFKYTDFFISNINSLLSLKLSLLHVVLPIGISFYTFQILSYEIDVYKKRVPVQKSFLKLATYVSLFPQLIAGPIVRYDLVEKELTTRSHSFDDFAYGIRRFILGLAKKVLIANVLGEFCSTFLVSDEKTILLYWLFAISYMLQIYFDFSAYSDMAIGLGRMFGFHFLENFNYPYVAKSITEFWRRWHISLSSWFRDYIYIPLGGNRRGKFIQIRNIIVVWLLTGFWHGASWNFILWGVLFGFVLIIEKLFLGQILEKTPVIIRRIYVLFILLISFVIFNASSLNEAFLHIKGLFGFQEKIFSNAYSIYMLKSYLIVFIISFIAATPVLKNLLVKLKERECFKKWINFLEPIVLMGLLILVTAYLVDNSYNPFLYFRF